jgi:hypothetical protein
MKLKSIFVCAVAWLLALGAASAAPATDATIEELLQVTHVESISDGMKARMEQFLRKMMNDAMAAEKLAPNEQRAIDQYVTKAAELIREEMDWPKMKPQIVQIYREVFTQEELEGQIAFYHSPVGQAMIEKMPQVTQKSMDLSQRQMIALMPKLQAAVKEAVAGTKATPKGNPE